MFPADIIRLIGSFITEGSTWKFFISSSRLFFKSTTIMHIDQMHKFAMPLPTILRKLNMSISANLLDNNSNYICLKNHITITWKNLMPVSQLTQKNRIELKKIFGERYY